MRVILLLLRKCIAVITYELKYCERSSVDHIDAKFRHKFVSHIGEYKPTINEDYGERRFEFEYKVKQFRKAKRKLYHLATDTNFRALIDMCFNLPVRFSKLQSNWRDSATKL